MKNNLENNQEINYKKYAFIMLMILLIIGTLIFIYYIFKLDINNFFSEKQTILGKDLELYNINKDLWLGIIAAIATIFTPVITVWGTYYFTNKSNKKQIAFQEQKFEEEKVFQKKQYNEERVFQKEQYNKEIEFQKIKLEKEKEFQKFMSYKNMNKNNVELIYSGVNIMYENNIYIQYLYSIKERYKLGDIFDYDIKQVLIETKSFLLQLKEDFYYEEKLVSNINLVLNVIKEDQEKITLKYFTYIIEVITFFYGFDKEEKEKFKSDEIQEKAFKKLWQVTRYNNIKENVMYVLTAYDRKTDFNENDTKEIDIVKNNKEYLEEMPDYSREEYETSKKQIGVPKEIVDYIAEKDNLQFNYKLERLVKVYKGIYEYKFKFEKEPLINRLGDNDQNLIEEFVSQIEKKYSWGEPDNYVEDFVKKNKYI